MDISAMPTRDAVAVPDFLAHLTARQRDAATQSGAVLVLAGAGTGKTSTLTAAVADRIATRGIKPAQVLAVTFTNKASSEMATRIRATLGDGAAPNWLGTFHGLGARQLRIEPEVAGLRSGFDIIDADDARRMVKRVLKSLCLGGDEDSGQPGRDPVKLMFNRISQFKDALVAPDEAASHVEGMIASAASGEQGRDRGVDAAGLRTSARVYAQYQRLLTDANAADFGDLLLWPTRAMQRDRAYHQRWSGRFQQVLADEFQDVNLAQFTWLKLLAAAGDIFCVGDDDQSIYGWRGADVGFIRRFTREFAGATVFRLEENFRSTAHILQAANAVIAQDPKRLGKTLFTRKDAGDPIEIVRFRNGEAEAAGIVAEMAQRNAEGVGWDDMAILYRANMVSRSFEEAMIRAHIPYRIVGDVGFYARSEIKDVLALLRLAETPDSVQGDEAFRRMVNIPARGFGGKALEEVEAEASWRQSSLLVALETATLPPKTRAAGLAFVDAIRSVAQDRDATVADQIAMLIDATGYRQMLRDSRAETSAGRMENIHELIDVAGSFHTARELLDHAALSTGGPNEDANGRVRLMTLHKGKGLEFPQVFLVAWESGLFPTDYGDLEEERRLAYVGLTRGMRRVTVSFSEFRRGHAHPSIFVSDIPAAHRTIGWLRNADRTPGDSVTRRQGVHSWT